MSVPSGHQYMALPAPQVSTTGQPIPMTDVDGNGNLRSHDDHTLSIGQIEMMEEGVISMGDGVPARSEGAMMVSLPADHSEASEQQPSTYDYVSELRGNYVNVQNSMDGVWNTLSQLKDRWYLHFESASPTALNGITPLMKSIQLNFD